MSSLKVIVLVLGLITGINKATAAEQSELQLSDLCKDKIVKAVIKEYGQDDETFGVVGMKLLYGGSKGGLHFSPVVLVRTSDEVEPRDVIVITSWVGSQYAQKSGCKITHIETVADGMVIEDPELDQ